MTVQSEIEIKSGDRFAFGENWSRFLAEMDDSRIAHAEKSICEMLGVDSLEGKTFLDIGSGSGLFSLAARNLGATVRSFDYDPKSVACTLELKNRYFLGDKSWEVGQGSVLDDEFMSSLGQFDVVYSWGVLHHTGNMNKAFENTIPKVLPGGQLFIAIYNDQGFISNYWTKVKKLYNSNILSRFAMIAFHTPYLFLLRLLVRKFIKRQPLERGMSMWHDMIDWLGGYPFEVGSPEAVFRFFYKQGFSLKELITCGNRMGCNEFVFRKAKR